MAPGTSSVYMYIAAMRVAFPEACDPRQEGNWHRGDAVGTPPLSACGWAATVCAPPGYGGGTPGCGLSSSHAGVVPVGYGAQKPTMGSRTSAGLAGLAPACD